MFITLEGIEGSGKSTVLRGLQAYFEGRGQKVLCTREPGGSSLGLSLRALLLNEKSAICPSAELFLFLADRAEHVQSVLRPALARGEVVICDRYIHSTIAYQGAGRGLAVQELEYLNAMAIDGLLPDKVLLLDVTVEEGLRRAHARNVAENNNEGRFDAESIAFHTKVRASFKEQAQKEAQRFCIINAEQSAEKVLADCIDALQV